MRLPHYHERMGRVTGRTIAVAMLVTLAACGGSSKPTPSPPEPSGPPGGVAIERFTAADGTKFGVQVLVTGLQIPWALAFAPDGRLFLTERPGRVRVYMSGQLLAEPALTLSDVYTNGESGILGLALHPDFASNHYVYLTYTASGPSGPVGRLMRFRESGNKLAEGVVLLDDVAASGIHNGSRVKFGPDRLLYVTYGDAANPSVAQDVAALNGRSCASTTTARARRAIASLAGVHFRASQSAGACVAPRHGRPVGDRARSDWQRRGQRARRRQQLRLAGHRRRRDAPGHDRAADVFYAVGGAFRRGVLFGECDTGVPEPVVRRDAGGTGAAARDD